MRQGWYGPSGVPTEHRHGANVHYRSLSSLVRELHFARGRALEARGDIEGAKTARRQARAVANRQMRRQCSSWYQGDL